MIAIALVEHHAKARADYLASRPLPDFYMEDYSIVGILVEDFQPVEALLRKSGYTVVTRPGGGEVGLDTIADLPGILAELRRHGFAADVGDVADTIYQA